MILAKFGFLDLSTVIVVVHGHPGAPGKNSAKSAFVIHQRGETDSVFLDATGAGPIELHGSHRSFLLPSFLSLIATAQAPRPTGLADRYQCTLHR